MLFFGLIKMSSTVLYTENHCDLNFFENKRNEEKVYLLTCIQITLYFECYQPPLEPQ